LAAAAAAAPPVAAAAAAAAAGGTGCCAMAPQLHTTSVCLPVCCSLQRPLFQRGRTHLDTLHCTTHMLQEGQQHDRVWLPKREAALAPMRQRLERRQPRAGQQGVTVGLVEAVGGACGTSRGATPAACSTAASCLAAGAESSSCSNPLPDCCSWCCHYLHNVGSCCYSCFPHMQRSA
jgi:hypothetical protein